MTSSRLYALVFWTVFLWAFWPEFRIIRSARHRARAKDSADAGSMNVIMFGTWAAYLVASPLAFVPALSFPARYRAVTFGIGLAVLVGGSLLRRHCWRLLGTSFTGDVQARPDQEIITRGAYRLVRHPSYLGGTLMHTGVGLAFGSWASVLVLAAASLLVYGYRIRVEERALQAALGERYRDFMRGRKRLIPFVY